MEKFVLKLKEMHPGVADMDASYRFYGELGENKYDDPSNAMILLSCDDKNIKINATDVIVPYSYRQKKISVIIKGYLNDYMNNLQGEDTYELKFETVFSDEPTFFDDFEFYDKNKWLGGEQGWGYKGTADGYVQDSNMVFSQKNNEQLRTGIVTTAHSFQQARGCFSARMKFPEIKNSACSCNCAFWLCSNLDDMEKRSKIMFKRNPGFDAPFGDNHAGEIDIIEYSSAFGDYGTASIHWFGWEEGIHQMSGQGGIPMPNIREGYHTISLVWVEGVLYWYYDGKLTRKYDGEGIQGVGNDVGAEMTLLLQFGICSKDSGIWYGRGLENDLPMEFLIDWVKVHGLK